MTYRISPVGLDANGRAARIAGLVYTTRPTGSIAAIPAPTLTDPTAGEGVFRVDGYNLFKFGMYCQTGATVTWRVTGWTRKAATDPTAFLYLPAAIGNGTATPGTTTGVTGQDPVNTDLMVTAVTIAAPSTTEIIYSPTVETNAWRWVYVVCSTFWAVQLQLGQATGTDTNAAYQMEF